MWFYWNFPHQSKKEKHFFCISHVSCNESHSYCFLATHFIKMKTAEIHIGSKGISLMRSAGLFSVAVLCACTRERQRRPRLWRLLPSQMLVKMTNVQHKQLIIAALLFLCNVPVAGENRFVAESSRLGAAAEVIEEDKLSALRWNKVRW